MDLRRLRAWDWLTGIAAFALLVSLFLDWYSSGGVSANAWESFSIVDVLLALVALLALVTVGAMATQRTAAVPQALIAVTVLIAVPVAILLLFRLLDPPGGDGVTREVGAWLGLASMAALLVFGWRSMSDKRFPTVMRPRLKVATLPTPTPDGERRDIG
jgi:cytochrome bd-type quinol oxidase subunit 2